MFLVGKHLLQQITLTYSGRLEKPCVDSSVYTIFSVIIYLCQILFLKGRRGE